MMKHNKTGITKKSASGIIPAKRSHAAGARVPSIKKNNLLVLVGFIIVLLGASAGAVYFLWPNPTERDAFGDMMDATPPAINSRTPPGAAPEGMVWVPGGEFWMGGEIAMHNGEIAPDSMPMHKVYVDGFWMDQYEVTNARWAEFARETGYLTIAEQKPDPRDLPLASPEELKDPSSIVFTPPKQPIYNLDVAHMEHLWWSMVKGASWKNPEGPATSVVGKEKYPAVHIAYVDAEEYCRWLSKKTGKKMRLPTEAEWEFAARGGLDRKLYAWGDELNPGGKWMANIWQGKFPNENTAEDGFAGLAPCGSFPPNGYGLYDMAGNAWEWCSDHYQPDYYFTSPKSNPAGPVLSIDPNDVGQAKRVQRGGSFLCASNYCIRYQVAARGKGEEKSAANHTGFRCVCTAK